MRIVIVEDEAPIREGMAKILEMVNPKYRLVGKASDGESGWNVIQESKPDLVIMDIHMPRMNGLEMLEKLRAAGCTSKFVILTAYSEFEYAKRAIDAGIVSYLLKPIKLTELKEALRQAEEMIRKEQHNESLFSIDTTFLGCISGQLKMNSHLDFVMKENFGFTTLDPVEIFLVNLGDGYEEQRAHARELMEHMAGQSLVGGVYIVESKGAQSVVMISYRLPEQESRFDYYRENVLPVLKRKLKKPCIFMWERCEQLRQINRNLQEMKEALEWNLCFPEGHLIQMEEIKKIPDVAVKYPIYLEEQAKQAYLKKDKDGLNLAYERIAMYMLEHHATPRRMKEMMIRFNMGIVSMQREQTGELNLEIHQILQRLMVATSWEQIRKETERFLEVTYGEPEELEKKAVSQMVKKASEMIRNYYSQGITLEETARKLYVSEEYLSTQFKKETGATFTETVRKYRIEKVKQLLMDTPLKMNQISELVGYSDPKYMSKVFKEEEGVTPGEFRKLLH